MSSLRELPFCSVFIPPVAPRPLNSSDRCTGDRVSTPWGRQSTHSQALPAPALRGAPFQFCVLDASLASVLAGPVGVSTPLGSALLLFLNDFWPWLEEPSSVCLSLLLNAVIENWGQLVTAEHWEHTLNLLCCQVLLSPMISPGNFLHDLDSTVWYSWCFWGIYK